MAKFKQLGISVFFPCYNDAGSIEKLVKDAFLVIKNITSKVEVIVIDDCSTDQSRTILKKLAKEYSGLKLIFHRQNRGYGGVLRTGFKKAKYDLVFYTDGDGQYDVKELPLLFGLMSEDVNFINGIKMVRHDPTYRIFIGNLYSFVVRWLFWIPIYDIDCDFRLIRKSLVKKLDLKCSSGAICIELVKKAHISGARFRQVSVHHFERKYGQSQFFRPKRILFTFREIFSLWVELVIKKI